MRRRAAIGLPVALGATGALTLAGCASFGIGGETVAQVHHQLRDPGAAMLRRQAPLVAALLIQPQPAAAMADTVSIPYARRPGEFAFYQFASWTERPVRLLPRLLQQRLEARGVAGAVGVIGDPLRADWLLTMAVDAVYHDIVTPPGLGRIALTVELFDRRSRRRVARQVFGADVASARADSAAATAALSQAAGQAFDALVPWLEAELQRAVQAAVVPAPPRTTP